MLPLERAKNPGYTNGILPSMSTIGPPRLQFIQRRITRFLTPTFLSQNEAQHPEPTRPTDFLDGMRGYAAFGVFISHFVMVAHPKAHVTYAGGNGRNDVWITQAPFFRLLYSGQMGVFLFFVISGFSISLKPIKLLRKGAFPAVFDTLVSATFRRITRLYVPCVTILLITLFLACCGAFDHAYRLQDHWPFPGQPRGIPTVFDSSLDQISDFFSHLWMWADPLASSTKPEHMQYATQLWTIPVELRCSFISFITIMGLAKVKTALRIGTIICLGIYMFVVGHLDVTLFFAGLVLAELHCIRQEREQSGQAVEMTKSKQIRDGLIFVFGLFLASYPRRGGEKAFYWKPFYPLAKLLVGDEGKKPLHFFTTIAAVLLVYIVSQSSQLQKIYTAPVGRYLGKISFAFYCVHQALIGWFGYRNILFWWSIFGNHTTLRYELGIGIAFLIQTVVTIWVADLYYKAVDFPSVGFGRWLEELCAA